MDENLSLLMAHADDGTSVLEEVGDGTTQNEEVSSAGEGPTHLRDDAADPNDLRRQRWGVVIPQGPEGQRLKQLIQPLIDLRKTQQGAEVKVYEVPPDMTAEQAARWKKKVVEGGSDFADDVPRYLVILGDLHQVSLAVQQILSSDSFAGRLCFDEDAGYESYVAKVIRWEKNPSAAQQARAIFHTVHDGTPATSVGYRALISPGITLAQRYLEEQNFPADQIVESGDKIVPSPDQLLKSANVDVPGVLFSLSHGSGPPRGGWTDWADKKARQGALSFGKEGLLTGADIANRPFLPGGIWFMLACFGGGTPASSPYYHWLTALKNVGQFRGNVDAVLSALPQQGERPFVATLPKAALANPDGPLAVMAHLDLAWTYSFQDLDTGVATNRAARFMSIVRTALRRHRAGVGLWELVRFLGQAETELAVLADNEAMGLPPEPARKGHLWMLRQDLSGYVLLGDPAAGLPLAPEVRETEKVSPGISTNPPVVAQPAPAAPAAPAAPLPLPIDRLEEAIATVILGERGIKAIAADYAVDRSQLQELTDRYQAAGRAALGVK